MTRERLQRTCWWAFVVTIGVVLTAKTLLQRHYGDSDLLFIGWLAYVPVGAVVARRRPDNAIGWVFLFVGLCASLTAFAVFVSERALANGLPYPTSAILAQVAVGALFFPLILLSTTTTFLLYPSGLPSPRWRPVLWLVFTLMGLGLVLALLSPTVWLDSPVPGNAQLEFGNPLSPDFVGQAISGDHEGEGAKPFDFIFPIFLALVALCTLAAVWSAVRRAWRSTGTERQQMRLFAFAIAFLIVVLWPALYLSEHGFSFLRFVLLTVAFSFIPISCGIAILRYRLYDMDRIIGRTTAYVLVTGVLLFVYGVVVTSVGRLLPEQSDSLAVAAATLAAAALFRPVLHWARRVVDRRFNREQFDAERAVEAFAARLRSEVETEQVSSDLLSVLDSTLQPATAGLWLRESAS